MWRLVRGYIMQAQCSCDSTHLHDEAVACHGADCDASPLLSASPMVSQQPQPTQVSQQTQPTQCSVFYPSAQATCNLNLRGLLFRSSLLQIDAYRVRLVYPQWDCSSSCHHEPHILQRGMGEDQQGAPSYRRMRRNQHTPHAPSPP